MSELWTESYFGITVWNNFLNSGTWHFTEYLIGFTKDFFKKLWVLSARYFNKSYPLKFSPSNNYIFNIIYNIKYRQTRNSNGEFYFKPMKSRAPKKGIYDSDPKCHPHRQMSSESHKSPFCSMNTLRCNDLSLCLSPSLDRNHIQSTSG